MDGGLLWKQRMADADRALHQPMHSSFSFPKPKRLSYSNLSSNLHTNHDIHIHYDTHYNP